jgi:putative two-component system response regulator
MPHRILVVDDKEPISFAMADYFSSRGYEVDCASAAQEAERRLRQSDYSLVITDLRLTGMDSMEGLEIVGHVQERYPETRTILLTAYGTPEIESEARRRGASLVLPKPQPLSSLSEKVAGLLDQSLSGTVLVVDDQAANRELLRELLAPKGLQVQTAADGAEALARFFEHPPDLVLLDIQMPRLDGFEVCRRMKADPQTRLIPVVIMTGLSAVQDRVRGIAAGADDFLVKPLERTELLARVRSLLHLKSFTDELDRSESVLMSLGASIEGKDPYTKGHCERLADLGARLAKNMGLGPDQVTALRRAGSLHDIGKIAVPDAILLKPGPLTPEEAAVMKTHPEVGERICAPLRTLRLVLPIIRHHHEKMDGTGYPDGLRGDEIPRSARILQIVDVYDALTTERPYRRALSREEALRTMHVEADRGWWDRGVLTKFEKLPLVN